MTFNFNVPIDWKVVKVKDVAKINESSLNRGSEVELIEYIDIASVDCGKILSKKEIKFSKAPSRASSFNGSKIGFIKSFKSELEK